MTNLFSVPKLLCLDTLFLFCGLVAAKMKQRNEKWHYQDLLGLAVALFPPISPDFWRTQQLQRRRGPFQDRKTLPEEALLLRKKTTQPLGASLLLKKNILCIKSHPKAGENERNTLKQLQVPCNTCFCKTWRTQASFWLFELFGLSSAELGMKGATATLYIDVIAKEGCHKMLSKL